MIVDDHREAQHQPPMADAIVQTLPDLAELDLCLLFDVGRKLLARDAERNHLRDREEREYGGDDVDAVPQEQQIAGVARNAGRGIEAHEGQHQPEQTDSQAFDDALAGQAWR